MASTNNKSRIKSGDDVMVIAGADRGKTGKVLKVLLAERRVVVAGVHRVRRNRKPVGDRPGGVVEKELSIDLSNVALWNATENRRVKVGYRELESGRKVRIDRKSGAVLDKEQG